VNHAASVVLSAADVKTDSRQAMVISNPINCLPDLVLKTDTKSLRDILVILDRPRIILPPYQGMRNAPGIPASQVARAELFDLAGARRL